MDIVKKYEENVLRTFLHSHKIPDSVIGSIGKDIKTRLYSLLDIWNDIENRRAILTIGLEEALHYEPANAPVEIKALVVVAIRNSEFENLVSTKEAAMKYGFKKAPLAEISVKELTYASIEFFKNEDLQSFSYDVPPEQNFYLKLLDSYPITANALRRLGSWSNKGINYPKVSIETNTDSQIIDFTNAHNNIVSENGVYVESGMEPSFSVEFLKLLQMITQQEQPVMFNDSFKSTTRNIEKLFKILEYVLDIDGIFVTNNFYISNGYVSKRKEPVKPMHKNKDMLENLKNINGLSKTHLNLIKDIQKQILS